MSMHVFAGCDPTDDGFELWRKTKGPSKGGLLNNMLFPYAGICLCHEINGMCMWITYYSEEYSIIQETTFTRTTFVLARSAFETSAGRPRPGAARSVMAPFGKNLQITVTCSKLKSNETLKGKIVVAPFGAGGIGVFDPTDNSFEFISGVHKGG